MWCSRVSHLNQARSGARWPTWLRTVRGSPLRWRFAAAEFEFHVYPACVEAILVGVPIG